MELISTLSIGSYFIQYALCIVLIGLLLTEYYKGDKEKRNTIFRFLILSLGMTALAIIYTCRFFVQIDPLILARFIIPLSLILISLFIWTSIPIWKAINKPLFSGILLLLGATVLGFMLKTFHNLSSELLNSVFLLLATFLYCFFVIDFLIGTSKEKK
jgi:hypothetical protein